MEFVHKVYPRQIRTCRILQHKRQLKSYKFALKIYYDLVNNFNVKSSR